MSRGLSWRARARPECNATELAQFAAAHTARPPFRSLARPGCAPARPGREVAEAAIASEDFSLRSPRPSRPEHGRAARDTLPRLL